MCIHPTHSLPATQPQTAGVCPAQALTGSQRQELALQALAGTQTITCLAQNYEVSRKFVYQQSGKAQQALDQAFLPSPSGDDQVLFYLPVTKAWLKQLILGLILICHSSLRGVVELLRDLLDYPLSVGQVHNVVQASVAPARTTTPGRSYPTSASAPMTKSSRALDRFWWVPTSSPPIVIC